MHDLQCKSRTSSKASVVDSRCSGWGSHLAAGTDRDCKLTACAVATLCQHSVQLICVQWSGWRKEGNPKAAFPPLPNAPITSAALLEVCAEHLAVCHKSLRIQYVI